MADTNTLHVSLRIRDAERFRLFVWELETLHDEMRVMASPHADRLGKLIHRFVEGGDDEGAGEEPDEVVLTETVEYVEPCPKCGYDGEAA